MTWSVCLVTDNEAIRHLFVTTFEKRKDLDLKTCATVEEMRDVLETTPPHALIISINLPDGDGYNLCQELKEEGITCPILLIEDIFEDINPGRCLEVQADGFISKPFEEDLIEEKVNEVLNSLPEGTGGSDGEGLAEEILPQEEEGEKERQMEPPASGDTMYAGKGEEGIIDLTDLVEEGTPPETNVPSEGENPPEGVLSEEQPQESFPKGTASEELEEDVLKGLPQEEEGLREIPLEEFSMGEAPLQGEAHLEEAPDSKVPTEEGPVPPFISSVLEESLHELEKMEAMETPALTEGEEQSFPEVETEPEEELEPEPETKEEATTEPSISASGQETLEERIREIVESVVRRTLEDQLPDLLKESLARLLAEISASLK